MIAPEFVRLKERLVEEIRAEMWGRCLTPPASRVELLRAHASIYPLEELSKFRHGHSKIGVEMSIFMR